MANGVLLATGYNDFFPVPTLGASSPTATFVAPGPRDLYDPEAYPRVGTRTYTQPQDPGGHTTSPGVRLFSFYDDFYNTIHVSPIYVDVGSVVNPVVRAITVWNGYIDQTRTLESIDVSNAEGIALVGVTLPYTFAPLESLVYEITVANDEGPAVIDARYELVFTTDEGPPFWEVTGRRVLEWREPPNWDRTYEETLAYRTEIITARGGTEQRIALRHLPRRALSFVPLAQGDRDRAMRRWMALWQARYFVMADWARGVTTGGVPLGGQTLVLDEPAPEIVVGSLVTLRYGTQSTSLEVAEVEGDTVLLASPVQQVWPEDTKVFPALTVHADASVNGRRYTDAVGSLSVGFTVAHVKGKMPSVPEATTTWRDHEVFLTRPNWRTPIDVTHRFPFEMLDSGRGLFDYRLPQDFPTDTYKFTYLLRNRDEVRDLTSFFHRCKGRRGEFFTPTWNDDLLLREGAVLQSGNTQMPIANPEELGRLDLDAVYRNIMIRLTDGTLLFRQVLGGGTDQTGPYFTLDTTWPRNINAADEVQTLHWLPRCRLAGDELTISWRTDGVAEATLGVRVLKDATL